MGEPTELHLERLHPTIRRLRVRVVEGPDRDRIIEHHGDRLGVAVAFASVALAFRLYRSRVRQSVAYR